VVRAWLDRQLRNIEVTSVPGEVTRWDVAIAGVLGVVALAEIVLDPGDWGFLVAATSALTIGSVVWRRVHPIAALTVATLSLAGLEIVSAVTGDTMVDPIAIDVAVLLILYAVFRWFPVRRAAAVGGGALLAALVVNGVNGNGFDRSGTVVVLFGALASFAMAMRYRARLTEQELRQARLAERQAIARELHDVVAHHVSAIAIQAQAAQAVTDISPSAAVSALNAIECTASGALTEMRRMVGILRGEQTRAPTSTARQLLDLADESRPPKVFVRGDVDFERLPSSIGTALFRIAQESVTNARRHGRNASFVDITVRQSPNDVSLEVVNDGQCSTRRGIGFGLAGMQERVEALGGLFEAGPREGTGWRVAVSIPAGAGAP
jgi:signal transduction histidine kinase